jgi:ubiquinone/menaquinone biosynthesis C-methylase UbiE
MVRTLSKEKAKAFYDRFGAKQDWQAFYEDPATAELVAHAEFATARRVFEFGCGTGRFAEQLLDSHLPATCTYEAVDISSTMFQLARSRLARFGDRARVRLVSGEMIVDAGDATFDRFVSNYVLDLLSDDDIRALIAEAYRVLAPRGLLCLVSLTQGRARFAKLVTGAWKRIYALSPRLLGGCRPIELRDYLPAGDWRLRHHNVVSSLGLSSEVVVAARRPDTK